MLVPNDLSRLVTVDARRGIDVGAILSNLRSDAVVLVRHIAACDADKVVREIAAPLGLIENLELQAGLAGILGRRQQVGKYFMSVNDRKEFQFISPHSEGHKIANMQIASFLCLENDTDGGETILMNVNGESAEWQSLRERVTRIAPGSRSLSREEAARAKALYQLQFGADVLTADDQVVRELNSVIPGVGFLEVLSVPKITYSSILERNLYAFWFSISNVDYDLAESYAKMLKTENLLREPPEGLNIEEMDSANFQRLRRSGVDYNKMFKCKITLKMGPGDLVVLNNLTWAHSAANWSPRSGKRTMLAAFA